MKGNAAIVDGRRPGRPTVDRREEILEAAQRLYDRLGFDKTTIADIARELGMSPANIYRSFENRRAIDEAIATRRLTVIEDAAWREARSGAAPDVALRELGHAVLKTTRTMLFEQEKMSSICAVAAREHWPAVIRFLEGLHGAIRHLVMEGQRRGIFGAGDPEHLSAAIVTAHTAILHPYMIEMAGNADLDAQLDLVTDLTLRALANKMTA